MDPSSEIDYEMPGFLRVHKSGLVERLAGTDTVPPSPSGDPANGVASKAVLLDTAANISVRLYLPAAATSEPGKQLPVVVFFHGGAFFTHSTASPIYHRYAASLAAAVPAIVVSVEYRLAPEHPLPAAYDDAFAALEAVVTACRPDGAEPWLATHGDASRVVLAGDSVGANIAHNTAIRLRKERIEGYGDKVSGIALMHSYFWGTELVGGEVAPRATMERTLDLASGGKFGSSHPYINPAASPEDWRQIGCGRVLVTTAERCLFVERSRAYADGIKACGWDGELEFYETKGEMHTYFLFMPDCDNAAKELAVVADFVRRS
jgi:acetyl esterase/lipase